MRPPVPVIINSASLALGPSPQRGVYINALDQRAMEEQFEIQPAIDDPSEYKAMIANARECFTINVPFLTRMGFDLPEPTDQERKEAMQIYHAAPTAPEKPRTLGTAVVLEKMLAKHDYVLPDPSNKMRNYVVFKLFEHAENDDPKISLKALEYLAKSSEVGLFSDKIEVNINQKTTIELESELTSLIKNISNRTDLRTIDAEFTQV